MSAPKLIPRENIPHGCRWVDGRWYQPDLTKVGEENHELAYSVAYYELIDSLRELVTAEKALKEATLRRSYAVARVRNAAGRSDYLDLPPTPWLVDDTLIRWGEPDGLTVTPANRLDD